MMATIQLKITWHQTNDTILFDIINQDICEWFVEKSKTVGNNQYSLGDQVIDGIKRKKDVDELIQEEIDYVSTVNSILSKLKLPQFELPTNWYDQSQLNMLHKIWAQTRKDLPKLTELLYKIDKKYFEAYQEMNCHIHEIEDSFKYVFRDPVHWRQDNPFKDKFYEWHEAHLYLEYPGHGRYAFEKFKNLDDGDNIEIDNVNWDNVDSYLGVNLRRPYKLEPPTEFLEWCNKFNLVPHTRTIPLANVADWRNSLAQSRQIMAKNVKINNNQFCLDLIH